MKFSCWSTLLEPPEEYEETDEPEREPDDMEDEEYYESDQPYHYAELARLRGDRK